MLESLLFSPQPILENHLWGEYISLLGFLLGFFCSTLLLQYCCIRYTCLITLDLSYHFTSLFPHISLFSHTVYFRHLTWFYVTIKYLYIHNFQGTVAMFTVRLQTGIVGGKEPMRMHSAPALTGLPMFCGWDIRNCHVLPPLQADYVSACQIAWQEVSACRICSPHPEGNY